MHAIIRRRVVNTRGYGKVVAVELCKEDAEYEVNKIKNSTQYKYWIAPAVEVSNLKRI
jgi:hypothetical protein